MFKSLKREQNLLFLLTPSREPRSPELFGNLTVQLVSVGALTDARVPVRAAALSDPAPFSLLPRRGLCHGPKSLPVSKKRHQECEYL